MTAVATEPSVGSQTVWTIDPSHSSVEFAVKHLMISTVRGRFGDVVGTVTVEGDDPTTAKVEATIGTASIDTRSEQRDAHLRSADFFDVETYPELSFRSKRVERIGGDFRLVGDLTIRNVTREVALDATFEGTGKDPWGGERAGFTAKTKIDRSDYGLTWNQALETGGVVVSNEIRITIEIEATKSA